MADERVLRDEHCACLDEVLRSLATTADLIKKCRECGLDVERAQEENDAQLRLATRLKAQFFPDRV